MFERHKQSSLVLLFVLPALALYSVIQIFPLFQSLYYSFFSWKGFGEMTPVGLANYIKLFTDDYVMKIAFRNVFLFSGLSLLVLLPLSFFLANSLHETVKFSKAFSTVIYLPGVVSTVIISLMWGAILNFDTGFINVTLRAVGLKNLAKVWLGDPKITIYIVILVNTWQWAGYHMLLFLASLQAIPEELYEVAELDGSTGIQRLFRITIPLMAGTIKMNIILIIIGSIKCFDNVFAMTYGGPADSTQMLATWMYQNTFRRFSFGYGSAIAMVIFALCIVSTFVLRCLHFEVEDIQY